MKQRLSRRRAATLTALCVLVSVLAVRPREARAGDIQAALNAGGEGSTWRGDGGGFAQIKLGYRFLDLIAPYFIFRLGYAAVDQRMKTLVQLGGQIWAKLGPTRPYLRLGLVHQHEESMAAVHESGFGAVFGVGHGIRHRGGFEGALGVDLPIKRSKRLELHTTFEALVTGFPDKLGPVVYVGGAMGLGVNYGL